LGVLDEALLDERLRLGGLELELVARQIVDAALDVGAARQRQAVQRQHDHRDDLVRLLGHGRTPVITWKLAACANWRSVRRKQSTPASMVSAYRSARTRTREPKPAWSPLSLSPTSWKPISWRMPTRHALKSPA